MLLSSPSATALLAFSIVSQISAGPISPAASDSFDTILDNPNALDVLPPSLANFTTHERPGTGRDRYEGLVAAGPSAPRPTKIAVNSPSASGVTYTSSSEDEDGTGLFSTIVNGLHTLIRNPKYVPNPKHSMYYTNTVIAPTPTKATTVALPAVTTRGCFPGKSPEIPLTPATAASLKDWWCPHSSEYAFMGFSYAQYECQSYNKLVNDFRRMKSQFGARYVRLYGVCDNDDYLDNVVNAAAEAKIGVYGLVWFGFDGDDLWKGRMAKLVHVIKTNPKAPYVIRNVAVGSEPLFDWVLSPDDLAAQIYGLKDKLKEYDMDVTISEMAWGFQSKPNEASQVMAAVDIACANVLPFFDSNASYGANAWGVVAWSLSYFQERAKGKPLRMTQTGWPSNDSIWKANNGWAEASVNSEKAYFDLLDSKCPDLKGWGVGYFAQIWSDSQLNGWGILDWNGNPKWDFRPRTSC